MRASRRGRSACDVLAREDRRDSISSFDPLTLASPVSLFTAHHLFGRERRLGEVLHRCHFGRAQRRAPHPHRSPRIQPLYVIPRYTRWRDRSTASSLILFPRCAPSRRFVPLQASPRRHGNRRNLRDFPKAPKGLPRQQDTHRNVPGFPQQRSTRRKPPNPTCSRPATTPVSLMCPISTSTCVPTLSSTPEPYASERDSRESRGIRIRYGSRKRGVFLPSCRWFGPPAFFGETPTRSASRFFVAPLTSLPSARLVLPTPHHAPRPTDRQGWRRHRRSDLRPCARRAERRQGGGCEPPDR